MIKRLITIFLPFVFLFSLISSSGGLESNANKDETTPNPNDQRPYTRDNAVKPLGQGGYYGGHDTITAEGMLLKEQVHKQTDADGGIDFRNRMVLEALPNLRAGAHDEDTSQQFNKVLNDPPIGPNGWGDFFQHFYNPDSGTGLKNVFNPATKKAMDYIGGAKIMLCKIKKNPLDKDARERFYDYLGRIMHLLQDMATPSHTKDDIHVFTKPFESYVNGHWNDIVNSDAFKNAVTPQKYLDGNYGNLPNIDKPVFNPDRFMKTLANMSRRYYGEEELIDQIIDPYTGTLIKEVNTDRLMKNVNELIPEAVKNTAGYIDAIYDFMSKFDSGMEELDFCDGPPDPQSPANEHPDDRFDVSDEFYWEKNYGISEIDLTEFYLRTAIKKGKIGVWYKKRMVEIFIEGRTIYKNAPQETKDLMEGDFQNIGRKLEQRINRADSDWKGAPDIALFANGFYNPSISLMLRIGEPVSFQRVDFDPAIVREHPVMLVPTGGFYGLKNSETVKALLGDYVKNGGTLVVLAQQHGYDWNLLPAPINPETGEKRPVSGYGYQEDQSCQFNSVYIDTYHPILSSFSALTANIGVDGYFLSYPDNSTILLRRVANGQPAMIMYPYGNGYVIAATVYTDFAFAHNQTNQTEINLIQNIISWAKKPEGIVEIGPGQPVDLKINLSNFVDADTASVKFTILDPSRKIIGEQSQTAPIAPGQSATIPVTYTTTQDSVLGIYHIDYALYDSSGKIVQPQAETDSGRFAVSNPPENQYKPRDLLYSVNTSAEQFVQGESIPFTVTLWNNSDANKKIKLYWDWFHTPPTSLLDEVTVGAHGTITRNYTVAPYSGVWSWFYGNSLRLWVHFFEEDGEGVIKPSWVHVDGESWPYAGSGSKGVSVIYPSATVSLNVDKLVYTKGETVRVNGSVKNMVDTSWQPNVQIVVYDPRGISILDDSKLLSLPPSGASSVSTSFILPPNSVMGSYGVSVYVQSGTGGYGGSAFAPFELVESKISVSPNLPSAFSAGNNTLPFTITNTGKTNVSSGVLDLSLKAPDGSIIYSGSQPFSLAVGETKIVPIVIPVPSLKLGYCTLTYSQSDETRAGNPTSITLSNSYSLNPSWDKPSYKIGETANLTALVTNTGKFVQEGSLKIEAPFLGLSETKPVTISPSATETIPFSFSLPLTLTQGGPVKLTLAFPSGDQIEISPYLYVKPVKVEQKILLDKALYRIRENLGINYIITNDGSFASPLNVSFNLSIPDLNYTYGSGLVLDPAQTKEIPLVIPLPETLLPGLHKINVVLALPWEPSLTKETGFVVPESSLVLSYLGTATPMAGDTISLSVENTGGVDTTYTTQKLSINDSHGVEIFRGSVPGSILTGEQKSLIDIQIPAQVLNGPAYLNVQLRDSKTGKTVYYDKPIEIRGLAASLQTRTDKDTYLITEAIRGLSNILNGPYAIAQGSLNLSVNKISQTAAGQFTQFLPKQNGVTFSYPGGVAVGSDGSVYVADSENHRIQKFDGNGNFISKWGSHGSGDGQFKYPYGIAIGPDGSVYVADSESHRIQKFDSSGTFLTKWGNYCNTDSDEDGVADQPCDGQFNYPYSIVVGLDGLIYVADSENHRIQKFDGNGNFLGTWGTYCETDTNWDGIPDQSCNDGQFSYPGAVAAGADGSVYVADGNHHVQKFDNNGTFLTKWGSHCYVDSDWDGISDQPCDGQFDYPSGIAIGSDGSVYVLDSGNGRIQKFDSNGTFLTKWGTYCNVDSDWDGIPDQSCEGGQFADPYGIAISPDGLLYVADSQNNRIQKFDLNGNFLTKWGSGSSGAGDGEFNTPFGVTIGHDGSIYITDSRNHRIQKFDTNGNFITKWGALGNGDGQFNWPAGIASGADGSVYVADTFNNRIQKFDSNGNFISKWLSFGIEQGFNGPLGVAVGPDGSVYVVDTDNSRIEKFDSNGTLISQWAIPGGMCGELKCQPTGIAVGPDGSVYVTDPVNSRIQKFDSNGSFITSWESYVARCTEGCPPSGIAAGPDDSVYAADTSSSLIRKFDGNGNLITAWGSNGSGDGQFNNPGGIAVAPNGSIYAADSGNHRIQRMAVEDTVEILYQTTLPINQSAGKTQDYTTNIGALNITGKLYLQADLKSSLGQTLGQASYPFYIVDGNTALLFNTDKKVYKLGEAVTITGQVQNLVSIEAAGLVLTLNSKLNTQASALLFTDSFNIPAGGTHPFTITTTAGAEGIVTLTAEVTQNNSTLVKITDQYEVAKSNVSLAVTMPEVIGGEPFNINVEIKNTGKVGATVQLAVQSPEFGDTQAITIPSGEIKLLQYSQQISKNTNYTFTLTGDSEQTLQQVVRFGEEAEVQVTPQPSYKEGDVLIPYQLRNTGELQTAYPITFTLLSNGQEISRTTRTFTLPVNGSISDFLTYTLGEGSYILRYETSGFQAESQINVGKAIQGEITMAVNDFYPEGGIVLPYTVRNTGAFDAEFAFEIELGASLISKAAFIPAGGNHSGDLRFNLTSGNYTIRATLLSQPSNPFSKSFQVVRENNVQMVVALGAQTNGLVPVNVNLTNLGFNEISGSLNVSVSSSAGQTVWTGVEQFSQLPPQNSKLLMPNINPSAIDPGNYTVQVTLLNNSNQPISTQTLPLGIQGPTFQITQLPPYQTFNSGQEATFTFRVKNIGNQEGSFDLRFKAYDLIDSTRREWLKPNEEKTVTFGFMLPEDLEEKDYFGNYELNAQSSMVAGVSRGQVKYHLAGINLNVNATLDRPNYAEGETAHLTINIQSSNSNPQNLFARVNYAGYEPQQTFTLSGSQVLIFDVPLPKITGEKLFYGIYHEAGRSIHLNSLYIHKAGDVLTITTNKQVYSPGESVAVSVSGNANGDMTLSGPGGYTETFAFTGSATKSFTLPATVAAGTYFINAQLTAPNSELITEVYPFDVAGIQVKVLECNHDKGKYASSDNIATSFTISSNTTMPAILKAWIVDPTGQYTSVGELGISLSSLENLLITYHSPLVTAVSGIHRLVYGIYGPGDLLLCSGSEAFDVGDAVLLGISTDKIDYPQGNESVVVKTSLYGRVTASLEFYLDGQSAGSQSVSLNGFSTLDSILPSVTPGPHTLKVVLTEGGLTSTKETTFTYGSGLPDLALRLSPDQVIGESNINVRITAINQGKSPSAATTLHLYDGEISEGRLLAAFDVPTLSQGESQTLSYGLNLFGRAGANTLSGVIDPSNTVYEFNESNNRDQINFAVPEVTLSTTLEKDTYSAGETVSMTSLVANLSKTPLTDLVLSTEVKNEAEVQVFATTQIIPRIEAMAVASFLTSWSPDPNLPEGVYTLRQGIAGKEIYSQKSLTFIADKDFTISTDAAIKRIEIGETAEYHLQLKPLKAFKGEIHLSLSGYPQNSTAYFTPNPVTITEGQAQSILTVNPPDQAAASSYSMKVNARGGGMSHELDLSLDLTDFQMVLVPATQTLPQIDRATYTLTLNPLNGFDHGVTVEVNDIPSGMRATLSAKEVVLPQSITLTLETSKWLLPGEYTIPIVAKARTITHALTAILNVEKNPLNVPGIVTVPGLLNKAIIHTFNLSGGLLTEFRVVDGGLGVNISAGDVDGDGVDEVIATTGWKLLNAGGLGVFRRDGTQVAVMETEKGYVSDFTAAAGDFDGDWIEEVVLGSHKSPLSDPLNGGGGVKVYKVMGNRFIDTGLLLQPYQSEGYFGPPNLAVSDVDGDGAPELITAPGPDPSAPAKIKVYKIDTSSGVGQWKLGSQIMDFTVPFNVNGFGAHLAAGDLDGDGCAEIIVGAGPDPRKKAEVVIVYHGDSGYQFERFTAYQGLLFGVNVAAADVDGDGISEILTGPGPDLRAKSKVRIFRKDGTLIKEFQAYPDNIRLGVKVSTGRIGE